MVKKRERLEVIYDILNTIRENDNSVNPTRLQHKSNLSPQMFKEYTEELLSKKFILLETSSNDRKHFTLTDKGYEYLAKYRQAMELIENFGL
jgi:predicted transcriptional regulator